MKLGAKLIGLLLCTASMNAFADFATPSPEMNAMASEFSNGGQAEGLDPADVISGFQSAIDMIAPSHVPLSDEEEMAIAYYTENGYIAMDRFLVMGSPAQPVSVKVLDRALSKLPVYQGDVIHMDNVPADKLPWLVKGHTLSYPAYLSTSKTPIGFSGCIRFVIHQKTGRDISSFSMIHTEQEVLIPHGSRFKIDVGLHTADDGMSEVEMTQI